MDDTENGLRLAPGTFTTLAPDYSDVVELAVSLTAAFVSHNATQADALPGLLKAVHGAIMGLGAPEAEKVVDEARKPAVPVKKSITPSHLISLLDGKRYRSLKRHLGTHGMTPDSYRAAFGLPADYPMVAPEYAEHRSHLARKMGLGRRAADAAAA